MSKDLYNDTSQSHSSFKHSISPACSPWLIRCRAPLMQASAEPFVKKSSTNVLGCLAIFYS